MLIIKIRNDGTGTNQIGNYYWTALINGWKVIGQGRIENFERERGWKELLKEIAFQYEPE